MNKNWIIAGVVVALLCAAVYVAYADDFGLPNPFSDEEDTGDYQGTLDDEDVEYSRFSFEALKYDTSTALASATMRGWCDWNQDGVIDWDIEIFRFTDSSGTYTSKIEIPISDPINNFIFPVYVQGQLSTYQISYGSFTITGQRNSDGSAKPATQDLEMVLTDDSLTYDGLIKNKAWDDSTDYNSTLYGEDGTATISVVSGGTASKGLTSQVWEGFDYQKAYGHTSTVPYYLKWDQAQTKHDDLESLMYAGTFLSAYMTLQDYDDSGIKSGDWSDKLEDQTNVYLNAFGNDIEWDALFYYASDTAAFTWDYDFAVEIDTALWAVVKVGFMQDILLDDYLDEDIAYTTAANAIGTLGADWDAGPVT